MRPEMHEDLGFHFYQKLERNMCTLPYVTHQLLSKKLSGTWNFLEIFCWNFIKCHESYSQNPMEK
jgi:hypothetical protein